MIGKTDTPIIIVSSGVVDEEQAIELPFNDYSYWTVQGRFSRFHMTPLGVGSLEVVSIDILQNKQTTYEEVALFSEEFIHPSSITASPNVLTYGLSRKKVNFMNFYNHF